MSAKPDRYYTVTPAIQVPGAARVIEFIEQVLDGKVEERYDMPDGTVAHCEVRIGDSIVMLGETQQPSDAMPASLFVYVNDVDDTYRRALEAGATSIEAPQNQFYGARVGRLRDQAGNRWVIATHMEDVSEEEMRRRMAEMGQ